MRVAVIGTGPIGGTLGRAFARGGRPVYLGAGQEGTVDGLLRLYFALAVQQGHGRHLAFRMLTDPA
jgi:predicted dinucleotide-binding enzyme